MYRLQCIVDNRTAYPNILICIGRPVVTYKGKELNKERGKTKEKNVFNVFISD